MQRTLSLMSEEMINWVSHCSLTHSVRAGEQGVVELMQIRSLFTIKRSEKKLVALKKWRDQLQSRIRELVDKLGPLYVYLFEWSTDH
jgi:hypothetical protein